MLWIKHISDRDKKNLGTGTKSNSEIECNRAIGGKLMHHIIRFAWVPCRQQPKNAIAIWL